MFLRAKERGKIRKENVKIKHETRLNEKTNVVITFYRNLVARGIT